MKVIIRAAYDFALWKDSPDVRLRKYSEDARRWLFEPSSLELSLEDICFLFNFSMSSIREYARNLTKEDIKKIELKERYQDFERFAKKPAEAGLEKGEDLGNDG